jgi:stage IV sporulation protein FB
MLTEFHRLPADASLRDAVDLLLAGTQQDFPVLHEDGGISGILTRNKLIGALAEHGPAHPAAEIADPCPESADPGMSLSEAMERLQHGSCAALPVMNPLGQLVGLLTAENVGETLMVRAALRRGQLGARTSSSLPSA